MIIRSEINFLGTVAEYDREPTIKSEYKFTVTENLNAVKGHRGSLLRKSKVEAFRSNNNTQFRSIQFAKRYIVVLFYSRMKNVS